MPIVFASITMSLDGYIAGENDTLELPLGNNGETLHDWILAGEYPSRHNEFFNLSEKSREIFDDLFDSTGALIAGRRTYDIVHGWGGTYPVKGIPVFVLTHEPPSGVPKGDTSFTFVADGIQRATEQAKEAAGDKNVQIIGGAQTIQQCIQRGYCDELWIHLVPCLLGKGIRLFENLETDTIEFTSKQVIQTSEVNHLHYLIKNKNQI